MTVERRTRRWEEHNKMDVTEDMNWTGLFRIGIRIPLSLAERDRSGNALQSKSRAIQYCSYIQSYYFMAVAGSSLTDLLPSGCVSRFGDSCL